MDTIPLPLNQLHRHPAQMRTTYDLGKMAELTLQVYARDLDTWQPIIVAKNGSGYNIISGHRRRMAKLFGLAFSKWQAHPRSGLADKEAIGLEDAQDFLGKLIEKYKNIESAATALEEKYGTEAVLVVLFSGDAKAEILALQAANAAPETPDPMGIAHSFQMALEAGASVNEIARNNGITLSQVNKHLALAKLPKALGEKVADGTYAAGVADIVVGFSGDKQAGLVQFILSNDSANLTVADLKLCAKRLKNWHGPQMPLTFEKPTHRNFARMLMRLWQTAVTDNPTTAWSVATFLAYSDNLENPWTQQARMGLWFKGFGGEAYFDSKTNSIRWEAVVASLLTEISCTSCPISKLPPAPLNEDLASGGVTAYACRSGERSEIGRCLRGAASDDALHVSLPASWAEHEGVKSEAGSYFVDSLDDLQSAWQAQKVLEEAELTADTQTVQPEANSSSGTVLASGSLEEKTAVTQASNADAPDASPQSPTPNPQSPIQTMRGRITGYMQQHLTLATTHPFATPCMGCQHKRTDSPTKDDSLPHCDWASRQRQIRFSRLEPVGGEGQSIPVCQQFKPSESWSTIIPEQVGDIPMPRSWVLNQIEVVVKEAHQHDASRFLFERLTGRPMTTKESGKDWFKDQLAKHVGELNDAQLWTLFVWTLAEWQRIRGKTFLLPMAAGQYIDYEEVNWETNKEASHE